MFPKNDLIGRLKEKDASFVLFCKGLEGKVAKDEDLSFFLGGIQEIGEIINEIDLKISVTTDEEEKQKLVTEKKAWQQQRNDYYREVAKIRQQLIKHHQLVYNGRYFLNEEQRFNYSRIIQLITSYDEQKQKITFDGSLSAEELAQLIESLHNIQRKINLFYQAVFHTTELLEEENVLPRLKEEQESTLDYQNYLRGFFHLNDVSLEEKKEEEKIEEPVEEEKVEEVPEEKEESVVIEEEETPVVWHDEGFENKPFDEIFTLMDYHGEEEEEKNLTTPDMENDLFDCWLDSYSTFVESPWIQKIIDSQNEILRPFSQLLQNMDHSEFMELPLGLLRNSALQVQLEVTDEKSFEESQSKFTEKFVYYRDELAKRGYSAKMVFDFSTLSALFQYIYLYEKLKTNDQSFEQLEAIRGKINRYALSLFNIQELIPAKDLQDTSEVPFDEFDEFEKFEEEPVEDNAEKQIDREALEKELKEFEEVKKYCQERMKNNLDIPSSMLEKYNEAIERLPKIKQELGILTPVTDEVQEDKYDTLIEKVDHLESKVNQLLDQNEKKKAKGKPFKILRKATNNILQMINRHKVLSLAIGTLSAALIGLASYSLTKHYEPLSPGITIERVTDQNMEPLVYHIAEEMPEEVVSEPELEDYLVAHIGDAMYPKLGIYVFPDQYVGLGRDGNNGHRVNYSPDTLMNIQKVGFMDPNTGVVHSAHSDEESLEFLKNGYTPVSYFDETYGYFQTKDVNVERKESELSR